MSDEINKLRLVKINGAYAPGSGKVDRYWLLNSILNKMLKEKYEAAQAEEAKHEDEIHKRAAIVCFGQEGYNTLMNSPSEFFSFSRICVCPPKKHRFEYGSSYHRFPQKWMEQNAVYNFLYVFKEHHEDHPDVLWIKGRFEEAVKNHQALSAVWKEAEAELTVAINATNSIGNLSAKYPELVPFYPDMKELIHKAPVQAVAKIGPVTKRIAELTIPVG